VEVGRVVWSVSGSVLGVEMTIDFSGAVAPPRFRLSLDRPG